MKPVFRLFPWFFLSLAAISAAPHRAPALRGISLGESQTRTRAALSPIATFEKEEEGQQVWRLKHDPAAQYLFVGFDAGERVRYVTLIAKPNTALPCPALGKSRAVRRRGVPGNYEFTRPFGENRIVIARGPSPARLTLCSLKQIQAKSEDTD